MEMKLIFISVLILAILFVTWIDKGSKKMKPPLKRRLVIDLTTIAIFWILYYGFVFIGGNDYYENIGAIIDASLLFFVARLIQLIARLNPAIQELIKWIKDRNNSK